MGPLHQAAGITQDSIQEVRATLAQLMSAEFEAIVEDAAVRTMILPGYLHLDISAVRPNTRQAMAAVLEALESGDIGLFGAFMAELAYMRARTGVLPTSFYDLCVLAEAVINELAARHLSGVPALLSASVIARRIGDSARAVIIESFQRAYVDTRAEVDRLANQFSAPILPVLPGVLVLPIVGAISATRAEQIIDAILSGIAQHAARTVILDLTGISDVDSSLPTFIHRATASGQLVGGRIVLVGISPAVARSLVSHAEELADVPIRRSLAAALLAASQQRL